MATLEVRSGPGAGNIVEISTNETLIGRESFCALVISDHTISRQHTRVVRTSDGFYVEDMSSLNGTFINGQRIQKRTKVNDQDRIHVHETLIIFHEDYQRPAEDASEQLGQTAPESASRTDTVHGLPAAIVDAVEATTGPSVDVNSGEKLRAVLEITRSLGSTLNVDDALPRILDVLFEVFPQADRGYIMVADEADGALALREIKYRKEATGGEGTLGPISSTMAEQVMAGGQGILSTDAFNDGD
ncbi:MAG: FHA domain-containing protein, partial [Planctomycetes bacterium]|nr:FHA domain-containing protein [Planctomycetota bacterium]